MEVKCPKCSSKKVTQVPGYHTLWECINCNSNFTVWNKDSEDSFTKMFYDSSKRICPCCGSNNNINTT